MSSMSGGTACIPGFSGFSFTQWEEVEKHRPDIGLLAGLRQTLWQDQIHWSNCEGILLYLFSTSDVSWKLKVLSTPFCYIPFHQNANITGVREQGCSFYYLCIIGLIILWYFSCNTAWKSETSANVLLTPEQETKGGGENQWGRRKSMTSESELPLSDNDPLYGVRMLSHPSIHPLWHQRV